MFRKKACPDNYQVLWWMFFVSKLLEQIHSLAVDETKEEDEMIHNLWQTVLWALYSVYYDINKILLVLDDCWVPSNWGPSCYEVTSTAWTKKC